MVKRYNDIFGFWKRKEKTDIDRQFEYNTYIRAFLKIIRDRKFGCKGYDAFGPFKLFGGIAKGHPDEDDIKKQLSL